MEYISAAKPPVKPHNFHSQHNNSPEQPQGNNEESFPAFSTGQKSSVFTYCPAAALSHGEQAGMPLLYPTPFQASQRYSGSKTLPTQGLALACHLTHAAIAQPCSPRVQGKSFPPRPGTAASWSPRQGHAHGGRGGDQIQLIAAMLCKVGTPCREVRAVLLSLANILKCSVFQTHVFSLRLKSQCFV